MTIPLLPRAFCALAMFFFAVVGRGNPVITEFMADNVATIADNHGVYSDWIEVHNPTASPINLLDWYLTDNAQDLDQWRFPNVTLAPGEFLIVWASGLNERNPALPLHTNFSLKAGGEFLALLRPDGTLQQSFAPEYPSQAADEAYGSQFSTTTLVGSGAAVKYQVPASGAAGTTWKDAGFDDTTWSSGTTGLGFGILVPGILVREVKKASGLVLSLANADALLGGTGIGSETTAVLPVLNLLGDGADGHYGSNLPYPNGDGDYFAIKATGFIQIPTAGTYSFGLNSSEGGRIRIDGANVMVDDTNHGPSDHIGSVSLTAGMHSFEVVYWEASGGEEIEFYARAGTPISTNQWDANFKLVGNTAAGGLAAVTTPGGTGSLVGTNLQAAMQNINATCYFRRTFAATGPGVFTSLALKARYADGYVAFLNGTQIAAKNAPASPQWDSVATAARTAVQAIIPESVNITSQLPGLINGSNVLAVQAMNDSAGDGAFLALPEIVAATLNPGAPSVFFGGGLATPGALNGAYSLIGKVADTQFSVKRGFFSAPFQLAITSLTPGATIRYTTNGSTPTATTGTVYSAPLNISATTVIRAAAFKTGYEPTDADTQTYIFVNDVVTQSPTGAPPPGWPSTSGTSQVLDYGMDPDIVNNANPAIGGATQVKNALQAISTICITTDLPNLFNIGGSQGIYSNPSGRGFAWERACSMEMINPPSPGFPNGTDEFQVGAGIRIRGGYSRDPSNPKHAFHFYFREDYGDTKLRYPMFGRHGTDEFDQIDLRTAQNYSWSFDGGGSASNTFMREESTRLAQLAMGHQSGRLRYLHLYINGIYWGLYETEERTEASFNATYYGGDKDDYDVVKNAGNANSYQTEVTDGNFTAWQDLWTKGRAHKSSPTNANYFAMQGLAADGVTPAASPVLLDVDSTIDYNLLTFYTGNLDGSTSAFLGNHTSNNWFGARNRLGTKGGFKFFAHDFEHSLFSTSEDRTGSLYTGVNDANFNHSCPMFLHQDLSPNAEYRMRFADRVHKHMYNDGALTAAAWTARWNGQAAIIDDAIIAESARWGDAKVATPRNRNDWIAAKNSLLNYPANRFANVISQLRADGLYPAVDAPTMTPFGGYVAAGTEVAMTAPGGGTIYYMADGSDPRAVGGAIRAGAQIYTSSSTNETLVPLGANWKYLADGSNQGTAWRLGAFNDAAWPTATAELGYGDNDEAGGFQIPFVDVDPGTTGVQKNATTYFRRTFTASNVAGISSLSLNIEYDDAAAVYINGSRVATTPSLPVDAAFDFYTGSAIEDTTSTFSVSPGVLINGTNVIAVEVHQASNGSSDISMNLNVIATRSTTPTPVILSGIGERPLRVRVNNAGTWSAMTDALFLVNTVAANNTNLTITEIMYHPSNPTVAEIQAGFNDAEMFEWIELTNTSAAAVDLAGLYFGTGIEFDFSNSLVSRVLLPGARILIVANKAAFEFRHGPGHPIAGVFSGSFDNGGEPLALYNSIDAALQSFSYDDIAPWPVDADGPGYSLVLRRTSLNPALGTSWRASVAPGGSPGVTDAVNYPGWKTANGVTVDNADGESDGVVNWLEYVVGGTTSGIDVARLPRGGTAPFSVNAVTQTYATLTYTRRLGADDVDHIVEYSDALTTWNPAGAVFVSATRIGDGTETVLYRSAQPLPGTDSRGFLRLRATLAP